MTDTKKFYKSKEVYVLTIAILLMMAKLFGVIDDPSEILTDISNIYLALTPIAVLVLRLFYTEKKIIL